MENTIWVYADWIMPDGNGLPEPQLVGELRSSVVRNKEHFSFSYTPEWLASPYALPIDPELQLFTGRQFSQDNNFRIFLDSCPDRWGRLLMKRREAVIKNRTGHPLYTLPARDVPCLILLLNKVYADPTLLVKFTLQYAMNR
jgi:serine/threonine-protein kinase HipA